MAKGDTKHCSMCDLNFIAYDNGRGGYCKLCAKEYHRLRYISNPDYDRNANLRSKYGLSRADYDEMVEEQNGVCAICASPPIGRFKYLSVDHDHVHGYNRGLLCSTCNLGIGHFKEDIELLRKAVVYLEEHEI